jgi:hypothetical protein
LHNFIADALISMTVLYPNVINKGLKMEKIVVLTGNHSDDNLVKCLEMLFPECMIEVLIKKPEAREENFSQPSRKMV